MNYSPIKIPKIDGFDNNDYMDFEDYMKKPYDCGKVINHKTINSVIFYLFQDNNQPPNLQWVDSSLELSLDQEAAISKYWSMQSSIETCGLPQREPQEIKIISHLKLDKQCLSQKASETQETETQDKVIYIAETPQIPFEFFSRNDFGYGLKGDKDQNMLLPIEYFESLIIMP